MHEDRVEEEVESKHDPKALEKYAVNITDQARQGLLDPVVDREDELSRCIEILSRRRKNNPVLIGDPGVGKSAIVECLAQKIVSKNVPESFFDVEIYSLDLGQLMSGAKFKGEFEERLQAVVHRIKESNGRIIVFIDEIHNLCKSGKGEGSLDAANLLKPALSRGELRCVGATTYAEYKANIEKDAALERRFQPVYVAQPSCDSSIRILNALKDKYEVFHGVKITHEAIDAAVSLSHRYITERNLPDKAIDLIDQAAASLKVFSHSKPKIIHKLEKEALVTNNPMSISLLEEKRNLWEKEKKRAHLLTDIKNKILEINTNLSAAEDRMDFAEVQRLRYSDLAEAERALLSVERDLVENPDVVISNSVTEDDIADIVSKWTKIPVNKLMKDEVANLLNLEKKLGNRVIAQDEALRKVSDAIRRSRTGLADSKRPMGNFLFMGSTGTGKAQPLDSLIVTPNGHSKMGDLVLGSEVIDRFGTTTKVTGIFPQGEKDVYRVEFSDGTYTECCDDHLWLTKQSGAKEYKVKPLRDFRNKLHLKLKDGRNRNLWQIPVAGPVQFTEKTLPLDPYLLGALLGNGGFSGKGCVKFSSKNKELLQILDSCLPEGLKLVRYKDTLDYCISKGSKRNGKNLVLDALRSLNLHGGRAADKFIPEAYLLGSVSQRWALLKGLMDCDGSVSKNKNGTGCGVDYCSASKVLIENVEFLVRSLGGVVTRSKTKVVKGINYWRVYFKLEECPFRIKEKTEVWAPPVKYHCAKVIKNVTYVGRKECQCISVSSESRTYLTEQFIVTHNTEVAKALAEEVFNSEKAIIRFDMSEFGEKHAVSRLIGSPPGYVGFDAGGQLTEAVRRQPYSVILFDEIEKAHRDIYQILLQLLDEGRLTDGQGKTINFNNTIIIITTNMSEEDLKLRFPPEFINRIDDIVKFKPLGAETLRKIFYMQLSKLESKLKDKNLTLTLDPKAVDWILSQKDDEEADYGARLIKRNVVKYIENNISRLLLETQGKPISGFYGDLSKEVFFYPIE